MSSLKPGRYLKGSTAFIGLFLLILLISVGGSLGLWMMVGILAAGGAALLYSLGAQLNNAIIKPAHRLYFRDFSLKFMATLMGFLWFWARCSICMYSTL